MSLLLKGPFAKSNQGLKGCFEVLTNRIRKISLFLKIGSEVFKERRTNVTGLSSLVRSAMEDPRH